MSRRDYNYKLRPAINDDHDAIAELWHSSASLPGVGPPEMPTVDELRQRVGEEIASVWKVTVAEQQGTIVGFVAVKLKDAVLDQLFVRPDQICNGLGRALFRMA